MVSLLVALGAIVLAGLAEWLHARRTRRIAWLAFGPRRVPQNEGGLPRRWARSAPIVRAIAIGLLTWGLLTLLRLDGAPVAIDPRKASTRHLLIALDVSPSMTLKDAGADGRTPRDTRARQALKSIMDRLDLNSTRVSVVAFYTTAKPVVVDTWDLNIVANILDDLPLEYAFKEGPTAMYSGVREAAALAAPWPRSSTTLIVVSDGDTIPEVEPPKLPTSISRVLVMGVGDPHRGTQIAGRSSRQDAAALKTLAARLRGTYFDANTRHLPGSIVSALWFGTQSASAWPGEKTLALIALAVGGSALALLWPALAILGAPDPTRRPMQRGVAVLRDSKSGSRRMTPDRRRASGDAFASNAASSTTP